MSPLIDKHNNGAAHNFTAEAQRVRRGPQRRVRALSGYSLRGGFFYSSFLVTAILVMSTQVHAQSTASIEGLVTDGHGALIAGAEIKATNPAIGVTRIAATDGSG